MGVSSLYITVERVGGGYISEGRDRGRISGPTLGQRYHLGELAAGAQVTRPEGAVGVPGDDAPTVEVVHRLVEVVRAMHVVEGEIAISRYQHPLAKADCPDVTG